MSEFSGARMTGTEISAAIAGGVAQGRAEKAEAARAQQLHLTHRAAYLRGVAQGQRDAQAGRDYRPRDGAAGSGDEQKAYSLGYMDGWAS